MASPAASESATPVIVFSMEGRGLKLDSAEAVQPFADELAALTGVTDLRLSGNTFNVEAAQTLAAAIAKHTTVQVSAAGGGAPPPPRRDGQEF